MLVYARIAVAESTKALTWGFSANPNPNPNPNPNLGLGFEPCSGDASTPHLSWTAALSTQHTYQQCMGRFSPLPSAGRRNEYQPSSWLITGVLMVYASGCNVSVDSMSVCVSPSLSTITIFIIIIIIIVEYRGTKLNFSVSYPLVKNIECISWYVFSVAWLSP